MIVVGGMIGARYIAYLTFSILVRIFRDMKHFVYEIILHKWNINIVRMHRLVVRSIPITCSCKFEQNFFLDFRILNA